MFNNNNLLINASDKDLYNMQFTYPREDDPHLQSKLLKKKELYKYKCSHIPEFKNYIDLKLYRDEKCSSKEINLTEQQLLLSNYFNVNSNQKGLLLFHGLGSGKTCTAITIAETFKPQCIQYSTKIIVLVPGPTIKESWHNELLKCTGNIYQPYGTTPGNYTFNEFYKIMSYKSFYRKVLGERVKSDSSDSKNKYKKDENGEYVRVINSNKLESIDNTLLICDEAHNITGNNYYDAVKKIINNSKNLKVLLLTGTPMKNVATDIIDLINLLKPEDKQIKKSKIFAMDKNNDVLDFVDGGKEYLQDSIKGYVSFFKSTDPYIFALQNDIGVVSPHLKFTKIIPCKMSKFHKQLYEQINSGSTSHLEKTVNSSVNFALPKLENDNIVPARGKDGIKQILTELKINKSHYNLVLQKFLQEQTKIKDVPNTNLITFNNEDQITGSFLHENFLHLFSIKFAQCLKNLNELVVNQKGVKTAFIYSNLVLFGINLFKQVLLQNGYMEFKENTQKTLEYIPDHIRCYYCGRTYKEHQKTGGKKKDNKKNKLTGGNNETNQDSDNDFNQDSDNKTNNEFDQKQNNIHNNNQTGGDYDDEMIVKLDDEKSCVKLCNVEINPNNFVGRLRNDSSTNDIDEVLEKMDDTNKYYTNYRYNFDFYNNPFYRLNGGKTNNSKVSSKDKLTDKKTDNSKVSSKDKLTDKKTDNSKVSSKDKLTDKKTNNSKVSSKDKLTDKKTDNSKVSSKQISGGIQDHEFYPACFISITGGDNQSDELENDANEDVKKIIQNVFCDPNNAQGKYIKFVLGSKVLSEGFNLKNVGEVHILDSWFNFTRIEQTIGRGIRRCSHMAVACEDNPYPKVNVYKYCIVLDSKKDEIPDPSTEELIYQNAERKHILIKEIEHLIKENTIDCALNHSCINVNNEKYKKCVPITTQNYDMVKLKEGEEFCPVECDYQKCDIKCSDKELEKYYNEKTDSYNVPEEDLDQNEINVNIVNELSKYKQKIRNLFLLKYVYTLDELMQEFLKDYFQYFDQFYFYKSLDDFIPHDENEKNNFTDILFDKFNRPGYLIYVNKYYIFQPFGMSEKEMMKYKTTQSLNINNEIGLYEFMKFNNMIDIHIKNKENYVKYDFETYKSYYLNRKEYAYVGIIDKEPNKKKSKQESELKDIFKLRKKITINTSKKRESGLQTYNGSVCFNSYTMDEIKKVFQNLKIPFNPKLSRIELCNQVRDKLYELEKYSTDGLTYLIIPSNHPVIPFPLNLKDRIEFIKQQIIKKCENAIINISSKVDNKKKIYIITIKKSKEIENNEEYITELGFVKNKDSYELIVK